MRAWLSALSSSASIAACVVLPLRSRPSSTMNAPRGRAVDGDAMRVASERQLGRQVLAMQARPSRSIGECRQLAALGVA